MAGYSQRFSGVMLDLGIVLFDRNTRGVRLTAAGRRFVDQVDEAVGIIDKAIVTDGMQARGEEGGLHIGVHALMAGCFLDRLLSDSMKSTRTSTWISPKALRETHNSWCVKASSMLLSWLAHTTLLILIRV